MAPPASANQLALATIGMFLATEGLLVVSVLLDLERPTAPAANRQQPASRLSVGRQEIAQRTRLALNRALRRLLAVNRGHSRRPTDHWRQRQIGERRGDLRPLRGWASDDAVVKELPDRALGGFAR